MINNVKQSSQKKSKILLIQLYGQAQPPDAEPLSIEVLKSAVLFENQETKVNLEIVDSRNKQRDLERICTSLSLSSFLVIGISAPQSTFNLSFDVIRALYKEDVEANIVVGHALPSYSPELYLYTFSKIIVVRGWGEESFVQLIKYFNHGSPKLKFIPNLCYTEEKNIIHKTKITWPVKIYKPLRLNSNSYFHRIEASRGCHYNTCTYCTHPPEDICQKITWFPRPISDVLEEVNIIKASGNPVFTFTDADFVGNDVSRAMEIANKLIEIGGLNFSISVRADQVINPYGRDFENANRRQLFERLKKAGLHLMFVGIESLSDSQLTRYCKGITAETNIKAVRIIEQIGVCLEIGFILFDPFLTKEELITNLKKLEQTGMWKHSGQIINPFRPQKGSSYLRMLKKHGILTNYNKENMSYHASFLDSDICEIFTVCRNWLKEFDKIYLLVRNFQRSKKYSGIYNHYILAMRLLLFSLVKAVAETKLIKRRNIDQKMFSPFNIKREQLISDIYYSLCKNSTLTKTEIELKKECQLYFNT